MTSIWNNGNGGAEEEGMTEQVRTALGGNENGGRPVEAYRTSKPPLNPEERAVYQVFDKLRSKSYTLIEKRKMAEEILRGDCGTKHALHARLLMGPKDLQEVIDYPMDIVLPILELVGDRELVVREKIAQVLAVRGDERAIDAMCAKLDADNYSERYNFGLALGKMALRIEDVEALKKIHSEIEKKMMEKNEFSSAWRYVRKRLSKLGVVVPKPEIKRVAKPKGGSGAPGRRGDATIPLVLEREKARK